MKITSEGTNWWGQNVKEDILKDYLHQDRLGSTTNLTDQFGRVVGRADYNEWGEITYREALDITSSYRRIWPQSSYTGHDWDDVLGMYYAKARFYSAEDKRFVAVDPVKGEIVNPLSLVPYVYCVDNPLRWVDPLGAVSEEVLNNIGFYLSTGMPHKLAFITIMLGTGNVFLAGHQLAQAFTYKWLMQRGYSSVSLEQHMPSSGDRADVVAWRTNQYGQETVEIFEIKHRFQPYNKDFKHAQEVSNEAYKQLDRYYNQMECYLEQNNSIELLVRQKTSAKVKYSLFSTKKANWYINLRQQAGNYIEYWFSYYKKDEKKEYATSPQYAISQFKMYQYTNKQEEELSYAISSAVKTTVVVTVGVLVAGTVMGAAISAAPALAGSIVAAAKGITTGVSAVVAATGEVLYQIGPAITGLLSAPPLPALSLALAP